MKYGYARVSTEEQNLDLQVKALERADCNQIYSDLGVSGGASSRPELDKLLAEVKAGDQLVVWRLDRLGRSLPNLIEVVSKLGDEGVQFASLTEHIDTSSATGELVFHVMAALAQFERSLIRERTVAGLEAAKARGSKLGRPRKLSRARVAHAKKLLEQGKSRREVSHLLGVSPVTLWRYVTAE